MQNVIIGGILPAVFIGTALTFLKISGMKGMSAGTGMIFTGVGVVVAGIIAHILGLNGIGSWRSIPSSLLVGIFWGTGTLLMAFAVSRLGLSMAVSASLAASNIIVVTLFGTLFLGEGSGVSIVKLLLGVLAIVIGSVLVTLA